jgi:RNA polymerase-binding transcription factor
MADDTKNRTRAEENDEIRRLLKAELDGIAARLQRGGEARGTGVDGGNFLDVAQGLERQEQENLISSRLMGQARRLQVALERVNDGDYGVCSECGATIPHRRRLAVPDATTCVACQDRLEHSGAGVRSATNRETDG